MIDALNLINVNFPHVFQAKSRYSKVDQIGINL
jgi:hypothetical protein